MIFWTNELWTREKRTRELTNSRIFAERELLNLWSLAFWLNSNSRTHELLLFLRTRTFELTNFDFLWWTRTREQTNYDFLSELELVN